MTFIKCESKFILFLILGIILLNIVGMLFQYTFISIIITLIMSCLYGLYFLFGVVKYILLKKEYICLDIKKRVANWLSSLI